MKVHVQLLVAAAMSGLGSLGIAVADYAQQADADLGLPEGASAELAATGERMVVGVAQAREQLATALDDARAQQDIILATCLEPKVHEVAELHDKAVAHLTTLRSAADADKARFPYVAIVVLSQNATFVLEQAAWCVGADGTSADVLSYIEPPSDPAESEPGRPSAIDPQVFSRVLLPPPAAPATTTADPSIDIPMEMPPLPPPASPIR